MIETDNHPGWTKIAGKLVETSLGALRNRGELLVLEWQEEKARLTGLLLLTVGLLFLAIMAMMLLTATVIFIFPEDSRVYAAAGFTVLYLAGAAWVFFSIKSMIKHEPFSETLNEVKKDRQCLESFK
jgi:uncharacterized membrane protein YqjE